MSLLGSRLSWKLGLVGSCCLVGIGGKCGKQNLRQLIKQRG